MTKRREKSDDFVVPNDQRKLVSSSSKRLGKGITANQSISTLELFPEQTAMFVHANVDAESTGRSFDPQSPMPLSGNAQKWTLSTMTMEEICLYANLMQAAQHVLANKGAAGPDGQSVDDVARNLDVVLRNLQHKLLDGSYQPGTVRRVFIPKTDGTRRGLGIPNVVDRIVQQAIHRVLSPHFEQKFHDASHGFRPGRSCHTAIAQAEAILGDGASHVVDIDLAKFFDTVNHDRLMSQLAKEIDDKRLLKLLRALLSTGVVMSTGVVVKMREGTPQGGPLSPLLSNIVLNELDWELEKRGHRFVRYADDCNIYVDSERAAHRVMASITVFIEKRLRLKVNQKKSTVGDPSTRHFLGFTLSHGEKKINDVEITLSKRSADRIRRRIVELTPRNWGSSIHDGIKKLNRYLKGWFGFFKIVTSKALRLLSNFDAHIRRRLRAMQLHDWGSRRQIVRNLVRLQAKADSAAKAVYGQKRSLWDLSRRKVVEQVLSNKYYQLKGVFSLKDAWLMAHPEKSPSQTR